VFPVESITIDGNDLCGMANYNNNQFQKTGIFLKWITKRPSLTGMKLKTQSFYVSGSKFQNFLRQNCKIFVTLRCFYEAIIHKNK